MDIDTEMIHRTPETSMSASVHGLGGDTDGEGSIPRIVIEGPPPYAYEEDIADQSLLGDSGAMDESLLTIPDPRMRPCAPRVAVGRPMVRVERREQQRPVSFVQRFTRGGLFDLAGLTAKSKARSKPKLRELHLVNARR